jgi:hypothetical protein
LSIAGPNAIVADPPALFATRTVIALMLRSAASRSTRVSPETTRPSFETPLSRLLRMRFEA